MALPAAAIALAPRTLAAALAPRLGVVLRFLAEPAFFLSGVDI